MSTENDRRAYISNFDKFRNMYEEDFKADFSLGNISMSHFRLHNRLAGFDYLVACQA